MRFIFVLLLFLPMFVYAQGTDTTKREPRLRDYSVGVNGGYGTGHLYSALLGVTVKFRKINFHVQGEQSIRRSQGQSFYVIGYRGLGIYYYNFGINPATAFPETFRYPALNRLTRQASGEMTWYPAKKLQVELSGSYRWSDDSVGFNIQRQVFTGNNFRTMNSVHSGGQLTERKDVSLEIKYPANVDVPFIKFKSDFVEETQDLTLLNSYSDLSGDYPVGFMAVSSNRDISSKTELVNGVSFDKLWLPWLSFGRRDGISYKHKPMRLRLSHTYRTERGVSHLFTRTDLIPENGPAFMGSDRIFYINSDQTSNTFFGSLSIPDFVKIDRPAIDVDFTFIAQQSVQPILQNATRIDASGANPENALYINSRLTTKVFTPLLSFWYKRIGFTLRGNSSEVSVHYNSGETISKRRFMLLPGLTINFNNIEIEYRTEMLSPGAAELLPNPDWRNPAYIEYGNPVLEFGMKNVLYLDGDFYKAKTSRRDSTVKYGRRISIYGTISHHRNPIALITQPDSAGILYARPVNLPYLLGSNTSISIERQFLRSLTLSGAVGHNWLRYDYLLNDTTRTLNNQTVRAEVSCGYQPGKIVIARIYGGYTFVHADYLNNKQFIRSSQSFEAGMWIDLKVFDCLRFYAMGNTVYYVGPQGMGDRSIIYVSTFVEWMKPSGWLTIRLSVNDIFDQNVYFNRGDAHGMIYELNGVAAGRLAMLTASWGFGKK